MTSERKAELIAKERNYLMASFKALGSCFVWNWNYLSLAVTWIIKFPFFLKAVGVQSLLLGERGFNSFSIFLIPDFQFSFFQTILVIVSSVPWVGWEGVSYVCLNMFLFYKQGTSNYKIPHLRTLPSPLELCTILNPLLSVYILYLHLYIILQLLVIQFSCF